ncbi:MAG TPA: VWA domain-containing protein [Thermoanaerobaculia bacterium]
MTRSPSPRRAALAAMLAAALVLPAPTARSQSTPTVTERAGATVIEIPVSVIGKDGKPVAGLKAADFELFDNGKRVDILGVDAVDLNVARTVSSAPGSPFPDAPPPVARRLWLVVFDLSYTSPNGTLRARKGAEDFIRNGMKDSDLAAVASYSVANGWRLLANFTHDREQLAFAITNLGYTAEGIYRSPDPLLFQVAPPGLRDAGGLTSGGRGDTDAILRENLNETQRMQQSSSDDRERGKIAQLMNSFAGLGAALDSVRGRKHILYLSEGFDPRLIMGNAGQTATPLGQTSPTQDNANEASVTGEIWKIDSDARFGSSSTRGRLVEALSFFNRSDSVIHAVDISGLRAEGDVAERAAKGTDSLFAISAETGGELVRNANDLGGELEKIVERTGLVYVVAFQPKKLEKPGSFHELKFKVKAPGAKVSARTGYYEPKPYQALSPLEKVLASGDLVTGGAVQDQIPARLLAAPFPAGGGVDQVPVILEIPGGPLLSGDKGEKSGVQIYAYLADSKGAIVDYLTQDMALDLTKVRPTLEAGGIKYYGTLFAPPGNYMLRALVRNAATGRAGVQTATLTVPAVPGGPATVLPPFFEEVPGRWVMIKGNPRPDAPRRDAEYPFAVGGQSFIPSVLPAVANGAETRVAVAAYNFAGAGKPLSLRAEIVGADGAARPVEVASPKQSDAERDGGQKIAFAFKPEGLSPGRYVLKVAVSDGAKNAESMSAFEVR